MKKVLFLIGCVLFLTFNSSLRGELAINDLPSSYELNFDLFGISVGLPYPWENDSAIIGWSWTESSQSGDHSIVELDNNDGSVTQPGAYHFGTDGDQAMGAIAGSNLEYSWEVQFVNNIFFNITNVDISFALEQWNDNDTIPQSLQLFYRVGDDLTPSPSGWIPLAEGELTSPQSSASGPLDGNLPANRNIISLNLSSTSIVINPGQRFWLRWKYPSNGINAQPGLAIDDFKIDFQGEKVPIFAELHRPKDTTFLEYKSKKGFKLKGKIGLSNKDEENRTIKITKVSYATFRNAPDGIFIPTDLTYTEFGRFKSLNRGRQYRQGYLATFKTGRRKNKAGIGLEGSLPLSLALKVDYIRSGLSNTVYFVNTFTETIIK